MHDVADDPFSRGTQLIAERQWPLAIQAFEQAYEQQNSADALAMIGFCHHQLADRFNQAPLLTADFYYRQAYQQGFSSAGLFNNMGICAVKRSQLDEAQAWFRLALEESAGEAVPAMANLLLSYRDEIKNHEDSNPRQLLPMVDKLLKIYPDYAKLEYEAACAYARAAYHDPAENYHDKAIQLLVAAHGHGLGKRIRQLQHLAIFDILRGDERFQAVLQLPIEAKRSRDFPTFMNPLTNQPVWPPGPHRGDSELL